MNDSWRQMCSSRHVQRDLSGKGDAVENRCSKPLWRYSSVCFNTLSLFVVMRFNQVSCSLSREAETLFFKVSEKSWSCLLMVFVIATVQLLFRRSTSTRQPPFSTASSICWCILLTSDSTFSQVSSSSDIFSYHWPDIFFYSVFRWA